MGILASMSTTKFLLACPLLLARSARVAAVVLALGCVGLLGGCSARHPSVEELRQVPGATASYPGTTTYRAYEQPGQNGVDGGSPSTRATMGCATGASNRGPVLDWFIGQLEPAGWVRQAPFPSTGTLETYDVTYAWTRGERQFQVSFVTAAEANSVAAAAGLPSGCPVVYDAVVQ